jgi:hypothetical protein
MQVGIRTVVPISLGGLDTYSTWHASKYPATASGSAELFQGLRVGLPASAMITTSQGTKKPTAVWLVRSKILVVAAAQRSLCFADAQLRLDDFPSLPP